tara:strand:+ start:428 stop:616 length:189 start_codon:yes stop_codon:yes gene_type:complete
VVVVVPLSDLAVAVVLMELQVAQVAVVSLQEFQPHLSVKVMLVVMVMGLRPTAVAVAEVLVP